MRNFCVINDFVAFVINLCTKLTKIYPAFTDQDIIHLWKGLWMSLWMSDKPLTQEKLAENLASLVHCFDKKDVSIRFYGAFLKIMGKEWFGIDQWRIDKFMMVKKDTRNFFPFSKVKINLLSP